VGAAAAQAACRQRTQLWRRLAGALAERTQNMACMLMTLEVSQLSGWLNAVAICRVGRESIKRAAIGGAGRRERVGAAAAQAGCRQRTRLWRRLAGARAERTSNMPCMVVTLDVSQLSGWLNADAPCRVEREGMKRAARRAGRREGVGAAAAQAGCRQRTRLWRRLAGARAERTRNIWYMSVTLDVSQLSGWLNAGAPCRVKREA